MAEVHELAQVWWPVIQVDLVDEELIMEGRRLVLGEVAREGR